MKQFQIKSVSKDLEKSLQEKIDTKTKPLGSLGVLEKLALKISLIQNTLSPDLSNPHIVVFAGDHGIVKEGVSAFPQEVTPQMVLNFVNKGAAINVFCKQHQITLKVVDAGVNFDFDSDLDIIDCKIAHGTRSFLTESAMSLNQCEESIEKGAQVVRDIALTGGNVIGFGEMGIGNTTSASIIMNQICKIPLAECVGRGTGLDDSQLKAKIDVCERAVDFHQLTEIDPLEILSTFGGFEIAMMCGAMLEAASQQMIVLVDGFIATSAFLVAQVLDSNINDYSIFCHQSDESGHARMLEFLKVKPLLNLNMRLGEGTGVALVYPIVKSAVHFLNEMASFESASVSPKT